MSEPSDIFGSRRSVVSAERVELEKRNRFNPLRGLTPDILTRHLEAFSRGEIAALSYLMEWLEKHDDTIAAVAPKAKAAVSRHGWFVQEKRQIPSHLKGMAEDQRGRTQTFFGNLEASDAVELEEAGGMRLFIQQIMDAYGKRYGAHHVIWSPSQSGLTARVVKVPSWMFEVKTGRMRFLQSSDDPEGVELETLGGRSAWFTSLGRGVMLASSIARMFKQIPLQDWLTYCDRHGMPGYLGKTSSRKGDPGWNQMADAVRSIGSEYGAVINTGDAIEVLDLTAAGDVPYERIIDRMDRAIVMLWRGGDLSTISRSNAVGSNPQQQATDELDADNAEWVSETINRQLTRSVVEYYFGPSAPCLVELKVRTRTRPNLKEELEVVRSAVNLGARVSVRSFAERFNIVLARDGEKSLGE